MKYSYDEDSYLCVDIVVERGIDTFCEKHPRLPLESYIVQSDTSSTKPNGQRQCDRYQEYEASWGRKNKMKCLPSKEEAVAKGETRRLEPKHWPQKLKHSFLGKGHTLPSSSSLTLTIVKEDSFQYLPP